MVSSIIPISRPIVLATASLARRELVSSVGIKFYTDSVQIDESHFDGEDVADYVLRMAIEKSNKCVPPSPGACRSIRRKRKFQWCRISKEDEQKSRRRSRSYVDGFFAKSDEAGRMPMKFAAGEYSDRFLNALIVTVDTAIGIDGKIIGKPQDENHAKEILSFLSGRTHNVVSAVVVRDVKSNKVERETTTTQVEFDDLKSHTINWYLSTGEWKGRAGAYAIQGKGSALIKKIEGCYTNVIGISLPSLIRLLMKSDCHV